MHPRSVLRELQRKDDELAAVEADLIVRLDDVRRQRASIADVSSMFEVDGVEADNSSNQPVKEIRNQIVEILQEVGRPIYYRDFVELLGLRGVSVRGKDSSKTISAHLSNDERFIKVGQGLWALSSWPAHRRRVDGDRDREIVDSLQIIGEHFRQREETVEALPPVQLFGDKSPMRKVVNGYESDDDDPFADLDDVPF